MATKAELEQIIKEKDTFVSDVIAEKVLLDQQIKKLERKVNDAVIEANAADKACRIHEDRLARVKESVSTVLAAKFPNAYNADPDAYKDPNAPEDAKVEELLVYQYILNIVS